MNHRFFEEWLLSEKELDPAQKQRLDEHLQTCEKCQTLARAWQEVHMEIELSEWVMPQPGFAQRWQGKLAEDRQKKHQRHAFWAFTLSSAVAALFAVPLFFVAFPLSDSPIFSLWVALYKLTAAVEFIDGVTTFVLTFLRAISTALPHSMGIAMGVSAFGLIVIWVFAMYRIRSVRRTSQ